MNVVLAGKISTTHDLPQLQIFTAEEKQAFTREVITASAADFLTVGDTN